MDKMGSRESMDWSNHQPLLPLSELKTVQRAELKRLINQQKRKSRRERREDSFHVGALPDPALGATPPARAHKGVTLTPKMLKAQGVPGRTRAGRTGSTKGAF